MPGKRDAEIVFGWLLVGANLWFHSRCRVRHGMTKISVEVRLIEPLVWDRQRNRLNMCVVLARVLSEDIS